MWCSRITLMWVEVIHLTLAWPSQKVFIPAVFAILINSIHNLKIQMLPFKEWSLKLGRLFWNHVKPTCGLIIYKSKIDLRFCKYGWSVDNLNWCIVALFIVQVSRLFPDLRLSYPIIRFSYLGFLLYKMIGNTKWSDFFQYFLGSLWTTFFQCPWLCVLLTILVLLIYSIKVDQRKRLSWMLPLCAPETWWCFPNRGSHFFPGKSWRAKESSKTDAQEAKHHFST